MSGDNSTDKFRKIRPVLGDVTNRVGKRGFSLISGDSAVRIGDGSGKTVDIKEGDSQVAKQVCVGVENLVKEKCLTKCIVSCNESGSLLPCSGVDARRENITSAISKIPNEPNEPSNLSDASLSLVRGDAAALHCVMEAGDAPKDSCVSSISMPTGSCDRDCHDVGGKRQDGERRATSEVAQSDPVSESLVTRVCHNDGEHLSIDNLDSRKYGSIECSRLANTQGSKLFELERCTGLKGDNGSNSNANADSDLLKACSCSFCMKAAYIWSDLHYQDMKGRIAALKKSQKEASILVQRSCRNKETDTCGQGNSNKSLKLESELVGQWRSLFLHMEDVLVHESSQLQASFLALKDLRENCKMDLEMINGTPSDK